MNFKKVDFYVSTGTGNTLLCAKALSGVLKANGYDVDLKKMESGFEEADSVLGIGAPVICLSLFPYVWKFIDGLPRGNGKEVFLMSTYGLKHHDMQSPVGKVLKKKGYKLLGAKNIYMPHNLFDRNKEDGFFKPIIEDGKRAAEKFAADLMNNQSDWKLGSLSAALKTKLNRTHWFWNKFRKRLSVYCDNAKCIKCGRCVKICPVGNIYIENEYPEFGNICELCARCIAFCPSHAIEFQGKEGKQYHSVGYQDLL